MKRIVIPLGQRFERWVVISEEISRKQKSFYKCRCDCGIERLVLGLALRTDKTKSCGCFRNDLHYLGEGAAARNALYRQYKRNSGNRNMEWSLSKEDFLNLLNGNCFYCGIAPSKVYSVKRSKCLYNGIDRVDNSKGYTNNNSVSCCHECNMSKKVRTPLQFINHCRRVIEFQNKLKGE